MLGNSRFCGTSTFHRDFHSQYALEFLNEKQHNTERKARIQLLVKRLNFGVNAARSNSSRPAQDPCGKEEEGSE